MKTRTERINVANSDLMINIGAMEDWGWAVRQITPIYIDGYAQHIVVVYERED